MTMLRIVGLLFASLLVGSCAEQPACCSGHDDVSHDATLAASDMSLFQLAHVFRDQEGNERTLADFGGHATLVGMIFTNCEFACPALVSDVRRFMSTEGLPDDLRVVLVSMDPVRDQPEALAAYARQNGLSADRYTLLHADADAVAELAAVLGVRIAAVDGGGFSHSNQIALMDARGVITYRLEGLEANPAPLLAAVLGD